MKNILYILIALLLALDNVFIKFKVQGISYDRLLELMIFILLLNSFLVYFRTNDFFRKWVQFIIAFSLLQLIGNLVLGIRGIIEFEDIYTSLIKSFSFVAFSFLFLYIAKKNIKYINIILFVHFLICIFAFLQHPFSPFASQFLDLKKQLLPNLEEGSRAFQTLYTEEQRIAGGYGDRFRLAGPFANTIGFSYFAISSFIITFYMYIKRKRKYYLIMLIILFLASILSQTRSLLLAEIFLVFGYFFFIPRKNQALYKVGLVFILLFMAVLFSTSENILTSVGDSRITQINNSGGKPDSRPLLWLTGVYAVFKNPIGISPSEYQAARNEMFLIFGHPDILYIKPHHGIVNIGFHYTIFGYVLFVFLIFFILKYLKKINPKYSVFFKLALLSYLVHTSFHNNFVLESDYPFLMVIMLISFEYHKEEFQEGQRKLEYKL